MVVDTVKTDLHVLQLAHRLADHSLGHVFTATVIRNPVDKILEVLLVGLKSFEITVLVVHSRPNPVDFRFIGNRVQIN